MTIYKRSGLLLPLLAIPALAGCVSFGGKPPKQLLTLTADQRVAAGTTISREPGISISVFDPEAPKKLDTVRIPVQADATSIAYVQDVQWVDTPRHLFQKLLSETIAASGKTLVLDPGEYSIDPGRRLLGELVDFGIDARSGQAIVTYDAILTAPNGATISKRRFSASEPVGSIKAETVGAPLSRAANKVAAEVAAWISEN